jgi:hypothetical protein
MSPVDVTARTTTPSSGAEPRNVEPPESPQHAPLSPCTAGEDGADDERSSE